VVKSSGVDFLDEIALDAFRKAQPFVNPPRGLADPRGEIDFTFGFYLETGGGFRMYRAPAR
jgi:TonB family protein